MLLAGWRRAGEDLQGRRWTGLELGRATRRTSHSCTSRAEYSRGPVGPVLASGKSAQKGPCGAQDRPARWGRAESRAEASGHPLAPPRAASYPLRTDSKLPRQNELRVSCWQRPRRGGPVQARAHPEGARSPLPPRSQQGLQTGELPREAALREEGLEGAPPVPRWA